MKHLFYENRKENIQKKIAMIDKVFGLLAGIFVANAACKKSERKYGNGGTLDGLDLCIYNTQEIMNAVMPVRDSFVHDGRLVVIFFDEIETDDADLIQKGMDDYKDCSQYVDSEPNYDRKNPYTVYFNLLIDAENTFAEGGLTKSDFKKYIVYGKREDGLKDLLGMSDSVRGAQSMVTKYLKRRGFGDYNSIGWESREGFGFNPSKYNYRVGGVTLLTENQLQKAFHLPLEVAVYVPSTFDVDVVIPDDVFAERIKEVSEFLSGIFGGYTSQETLGGYVAEDGKLVKEDVVKVTSFATDEAFSKNKTKLLQRVQKWAKDWKQEAIGIEFEGDLFYVPKKFEQGGRLGFENLAKKVAKNYEGKMVKPSFQNEYGVRYDKQEALEVGRKVAAKVYRQQQSKKG